MNPNIGKIPLPIPSENVPFSSSLFWPGMGPKIHEVGIIKLRMPLMGNFWTSNTSWEENLQMDFVANLHNRRDQTAHIFGRKGKALYKGC